MCCRLRKSAAVRVMRREAAGFACEATLMLWILLPDGLNDDVVAAASASGLAQIEKEMRLMKVALEARGAAS